MKALEFDIHLKEPLLLSQPGAGEENSAVSRDYIPGATILGVAANEYIKRNNIKDAAVDSTCRRLFFDGSSCFLNAYIKPMGQRFLPTPLSWFTSKDEAKKDNATLYDFGVEENEELENATHPYGSYCCDEEGEKTNVYITSPQFNMMVHNMSLDRNEKVEGKSTVYRYQALAPNQVFSGAVICIEENDLEIIKDLLDQKYFRLGTSRSAGYGLVYIEAKLNNNWEEYTQDEYDESEDKISVTLLSDTIVINKQGENTLNAYDLFGVKPVKAYYEPKLMSGFNRKWGLPLPQMHAFKAGGVFVYNESEIDKDMLEKARMFGIGLRRAEGFGRIAVNWHGQPTITRKSLSEPRKSRKTPKLSANSISMAEKLVERLWREVLNDKLADALQKLEIRRTGITGSQLERLRNVSHKMWFNNDEKVLLDYIHGIKDIAKSQLESTKVDSKNLYEWLSDDFCNKIWEDRLKPDHEPKLGDVKLPEETLKKLKVEYSARLLDGLIKKVLKAGENI